MRGAVLRRTNLIRLSTEKQHPGPHLGQPYPALRLNLAESPQHNFFIEMYTNYLLYRNLTVLFIPSTLLIGHYRKQTN